MRHANVQTILRSLDAVEHERETRRGAPALNARTDALKRYQQTRFRLSHADLLASPRYGPAARFFLDELYGPRDFTQRDAQFARIVPALVRLFPQAIVDTVGTLGELHALSESLDSDMAARLASEAIDAEAYVEAWQATGRSDDRERQVVLTLEVGAALDDYTRKPLLMSTLRMMRGPARAAGLSELQVFLEHGFTTFKGMGGGADFLQRVGRTERRCIELLFDATPAGGVRRSGQLP